MLDFEICIQREVVLRDERREEREWWRTRALIGRASRRLGQMVSEALSLMVGIWIVRWWCMEVDLAVIVFCLEGLTILGNVDVCGFVVLRKLDAVWEEMGLLPEERNFQLE